MFNTFHYQYLILEKTENKNDEGGVFHLLFLSPLQTINTAKHISVHFNVVGIIASLAWRCDPATLPRARATRFDGLRGWRNKKLDSLCRICEAKGNCRGAHASEPARRAAHAQLEQQF